MLEKRRRWKCKSESASIKSVTWKFTIAYFMWSLKLAREEKKKSSSDSFHGSRFNATNGYIKTKRWLLKLIPRNIFLRCSVEKTIKPSENKLKAEAWNSKPYGERRKLCWNKKKTSERRLKIIYDFRNALAVPLMEKGRIDSTPSHHASNIVACYCQFLN